MRPVECGETIPAMKTILAPIDFSPVSRRVIAEATALARAVRGRVVLLHVVQPPVIVGDYGMMLSDLARMTADSERASARHLARLKKSLQRHLPAVQADRRTGAAVLEIMNHAKLVAADYLVLGSHGHTAFHDLLVGSTAAGVLKRARCPVVIVPPGPRKAGGKK
jgi:nucleotide-binding universal stress UspA family protein